MENTDPRIHTTLNLSKHLISEAQKLFRDKTKTEIIHEALARMIRVEKMEKHLKKWKGKDMSVNVLAINQNLNKIVSNGYKLIASHGGSADYVMTTTYTFIKE